MTLISAAARSAPGRRSSAAACFGALLSIGAYTALLGPLLPELADRAGIGIGDAGAVFTALFVGAIVSTAAGGRAVDRFGRRWPLVAGLAVNGAALLLIPWAGSWPALLGLFVLLGLGDGTVIVGAHVLVAELNPDDEAAALNRLNVFFGVGAVVGPAAAAVAGAGGIRGTLVLLVLGGLQLVWATVLAARAVGRTSRPAAHATAEPVRLRSSALIWTLAPLLLIYVGVEIGLGGWAFTYARGAAGLSNTGAALLSSGFWCALTLGRLLSPLVLRRLAPATLLLLAPLVAAAGAALLVVAGSAPAPLVVGVVITGIGSGPVWPVTFAIANRTFRGAEGRATGLLGMVSAVGGIALPWLQGRVLDAAGPTAGITVTLAGCLGVAVLAVRVRALTAAY